MPAISSNLAVSPHETASSFAELGVPSALAAALAARGITTPRPIQAHTLPDGLAGRDVLGRAETGSGKTLAFGLPMLIRTATAGGGRLARRPRGLVLVPTRELADQVHDELHALAAVLSLRLLTVYGGVSLQRQVQELRRGIDVVVATPGRLQDLVRQGACSLDAVDIAVLDEADHMADMGFLPAVTWLLDRVPPGGQRLLFSATLDGQVDTLVRRYLADPVRHVVMPTAAATARMDHQIRTVQATDKVAVAAELAARPGRTLLFVRTKHRAARLARQLDRAGLRAGALHGDLAQPARTRALAAFAAGTVPVLVATDIAARGIHVDGIDLVVHFDPPAEPKAYLHRSGRTARAGAAGTVVTLVLPEQATEVANLHRRAGVAAPPPPADPAPPRPTARPDPRRPGGRRRRRRVAASS
ncbi:MAG TPA: DEAD/DEAH box helicase [Actinomycetota bacterium]|nr:DEAD/DEAH box helicase [Actinomycetota bacterium]